MVARELFKLSYLAKPQKVSNMFLCCLVAQQFERVPREQQNFVTKREFESKARSVV